MASAPWSIALALCPWVFGAEASRPVALALCGLGGSKLWGALVAQLHLQGSHELLRMLSALSPAAHTNALGQRVNVVLQAGHLLFNGLGEAVDIVPTIVKHARALHHTGQLSQLAGRHFNSARDQYRCLCKF